MSVITKIAINDYTDIMTARLKTREVARNLGFGTVDQARISIAASELAQVLADHIGSQGEIVISDMKTNGQLGIQVVSVNPQPVAASLQSAQPATNAANISKAVALVDEYMVEDHDQEGTRVTLMKWLSKRS